MARTAKPFTVVHRAPRSVSFEIKKRIAPTHPSPAPPAPAPAPSTGDLSKYNAEQVNAYRARKNLPPLVLDAGLSAFALRASKELAAKHVPHALFASNVARDPIFRGASSENQGAAYGVPRLDADPVRNGRRQIDQMLTAMFAEGPSGAHYRNMMNPAHRRLGVGLYDVGGRLYLTNDFSG